MRAMRLTASMSREARLMSRQGVMMGEFRSNRRRDHRRLARRAPSSRTPARAARRPHARDELPQLRRAAERAVLRRVRAACACPPHACAPSSTTSSHGVLHFEGKIWRTLPLLAWRPGRADAALHRRRSGRSFISPIALFLFCVFLMFAVIGLTSSSAQAPATSGEGGPARPSMPRTRQQHRQASGAASRG